MMRQRILLVLLTMVGMGSGVRSQNVFSSYADDAKWHVLHCFWTDCETHVKTFEGAIDLCDHQYSFRTFPSGEVAYFRSDSLRAYFRRTDDCSDKEYLLYDFSLEVGDTTYVGFELWSSWNPADTAAFKLASIDTITQFGVSRRRFNMLHGFPDIGITELHRPMAWIEGVGSDQDPFYPFLCLWDGCESWYTTLCYDSIGTQLYQDSYFEACDTSIVGIVESAHIGTVRLSPNPFTHSIRVSTDERVLNVEVISIFGKRVALFEGRDMTMEIELPNHLSDGMYIVRVRTERGMAVQKMLKTSPCSPRFTGVPNCHPRAKPRLL